MRRFFPLLLLMLPLYAVSQDLPKQDPPKQDPAKQGAGRGGAPHKNLKILKDENIGMVMRGFTVALGVPCTFCHVQGDFASDANPKKDIGRYMIAMTRDINAKFPDGKDHVACYTCHRGSNAPLMTPPAAAPGGGQ
jgi:hypothetical protein